MISVDSNKTQNPGTIAASDLPDTQQAAITMRTTRGHAAKQDTNGNGKLVYSILCMYVHVQILRSHVWIISDSKMGQVSGSPDVPESQEAIISKNGKLCVLSTCKGLSSCHVIILIFKHSHSN